VSPVKYELGFCIPEDDILHSHRRENFKSYFDDMYNESNEYHFYLFAFVHLMTMKNAVFLDVTPCGSCKNRCFGGT
jgi:hypothetical protein